jgi:ubiquitin C-terminal hydrolase
LNDSQDAYGLDSPGSDDESDAIEADRHLQPYRGLANPGHACYANAVLQVLAFVDSISSTVQAAANDSFPVLSNLSSVVSRLGPNSARPVDVPSGSYYVNSAFVPLRRLHAILGVNESQDPEEFLLQVLTLVRREMKAALPLHSEIVGDFLTPLCALFRVQMRTCSRCSNEACAYAQDFIPRDETFLKCRINVQHDGALNFADLMQAHLTEKHAMEGTCVCGAGLTSHEEVMSLPQHLVIQLGRTVDVQPEENGDVGFVRLANPVVLPRLMCASSFLPAGSPLCDATYVLRAKIVHYPPANGSSGFADGHYVTVVYQDDNAFVCDDAAVRPMVENANDADPNVYLVFYELVASDLVLPNWPDLTPEQNDALQQARENPHLLPELFQGERNGIFPESLECVVRDISAPETDRWISNHMLDHLGACTFAALQLPNTIFWDTGNLRKFLTDPNRIAAKRQRILARGGALKWGFDADDFCVYFLAALPNHFIFGSLVFRHNLIEVQLGDNLKSLRLREVSELLNSISIVFGDDRTINVTSLGAATPVQPNFSDCSLCSLLSLTQLAVGKEIAGRARVFSEVELFRLRKQIGHQLVAGTWQSVGALFAPPQDL